MGNVSDKELEYMNYTLGDIYVIELLISHRYKYDDYLFMGDSFDVSVTGALRLNEEILITYADLDQYIKWCNFSNQQLKIIKLISEGYSHEEVAEILNIRPSTVSGRLQTIYKRIVKENEWQWRKSTYVSRLGLRTKTCSKCKEKLPATVEFYRHDDRNRDGFQSRCKKCES